MNQTKLLYEHFLIKEKIIEKYLNPKEEYEILGANYIKDYYFAVIKKLSTPNDEYKLIVENCKNPYFVDLKRCELDSDYVKFQINLIKNNLPENIYSLLLRQGLCQKLETGYSKYNCYCTIHRLCACLYSNILNLEVHHIDKVKDNNSILNLCSVEEKYHDELDLLTGYKYFLAVDEVLEEFRRNVRLQKCKRNTLSNRDDIILEVLKELYNNPSVNKIKNKFKKILGKTKLYQIKNRYFYYKEFIESLNNGYNEPLSSFNEKDRFCADSCLTFIREIEKENALYKRIKGENKYINQRALKKSLKPNGDAYY